MIRHSPQERASDILEPNITTHSSHILAWRDSPVNTGDTATVPSGSLSNAQNQAILIAALSCACISLVVVLITLRWFLIMRRSFRHRLVLYLIISDTSKAIGYFVFPIVVFARGPVNNSSKFCQASGFLLALAVESSDVAILIIALHSILYIVRPNNTLGEGGLYRYRHWIYVMWLGLPLLAASLAFIDNKDAYVTAGTFCYLPKRPFWYRLALSWVPRYLVISVILIMYIWIYIYVHIKFRGFDNLGETDSSYESEMRQRSDFSTKSAHIEGRSTNQSSTRPSQTSMQNRSPGVILTAEECQPRDEMSFITQRPPHGTFRDTHQESEGRNMLARGSEWSGDTQVPPANTTVQGVPSPSATSERQSRSMVPQPPSPAKGEACGTSIVCPATAAPFPSGVNDPLKRTRLAIRKQLRYLFIYPLVYIIMWSFPFASHALNYSNYYVQHPIFWLSLVQTIMLSLQAGIDSMLFSWTEKPWRRIEPSSKFSIPFLQRRSKAFLQRWGSEMQATSLSEGGMKRQPSAKQNSHWWEVEGRRRNDSVWLGTNTISDTFSPITTRARSRSPEKVKRNLHSRTRSSEHGTSFVPRLGMILPGTHVPRLSPVLQCVPAIYEQENEFKADAPR
ncbi:uncharacterized protein Z519_01396 [Cladophialophora bantiana CBS 173.52]|uniref:G-protein coupled receptors family 1 profile domain-containing protein n=1 Tax=Cladophialophora bantiana (strain ATCC 10958 / CBS 173.52 / CDC B-1940 / NIH 8579) TaxID=1442370 RepID=A0A0D2GHG5_CLAB1|nr:uncharacterized protein Z519_01396 [Cladophialophora bantiana CBS 173.52]KIW97812.1 hypothetical protein Z519_01396 [Cladophialophora bantiana CBS 173.52]